MQSLTAFSTNQLLELIYLLTLSIPDKPLKMGIISLVHKLILATHDFNNSFKLYYVFLLYLSHFPAYKVIYTFYNFYFIGLFLKPLHHFEQRSDTFYQKFYLPIACGSVKFLFSFYYRDQSKHMRDSSSPFIAEITDNTSTMHQF